MTVVADEAIHVMPWRGYDDPTLPEAIWWGSAVVVGDASGGTMNARLCFKNEGDPVSGNIWNLEEFNAFLNDQTLSSMFMKTVGLAPTKGAAFVDRQYALETFSTGSANGQAVLRGGRGGSEGMLKLPTMLGTVRGVADDIAVLTFGRNNEGAATSLAVTAFGYQWGPRSMMAEGGPQRPPQSVFGG